MIERLVALHACIRCDKKKEAPVDVLVQLVEELRVVGEDERVRSAGGDDPLVGRLPPPCAGAVDLLDLFLVELLLAVPVQAAAMQDADPAPELLLHVPLHQLRQILGLLRVPVVVVGLGLRVAQRLEPPGLHAVPLRLDGGAEAAGHHAEQPDGGPATGSAPC